MIRVTMNLTERDEENTKVLQERLSTRTRADAVGNALAISRLLADEIHSGKEVLVRGPDGTLERLVFPNIR